MRGAHRHIDVAVMSCAVQFVSCVSGFAQSNNGYRASAVVDHTSVGVLREYVADAIDAPADVPGNLDIPAPYRPLLETMLQRSATFRRQCVRLANSPELAIHLRTAGPPLAQGPRARTQISRRGARLDATVDLYFSDDPVELIAHELEHIIEQLDGVDLASKAGLTSSGVHLRTGDGTTYETDRAIRTGLAVRAEVRRGS